ncbi:tetratricopeptide repeat protein [candidate division KSB1 bacterium]|nr:tetratricopeptide repeat protein [candidate division KSB1 bacterium]
MKLTSYLTHKIIRQLLFILIISGMWSLLSSQNKAAKRWFDEGERASQLDEKITFYQKAIALDPSYTESYYRLGTIYRKKGDLEQATHFLGRALFSRPSDMDPNLRFKIVFEIGQIQSRTRKYREARESLIGALNLIDNKDQKILVLDELATVLIALRDYEGAITRYNEAARINPKNIQKYQQSVNHVKKLQEIDEDYQKANEFFMSRRYKNAITLFENIMKTDSTYRDVREKLKIARHELVAIQKQEQTWASSEQNQIKPENLAEEIIASQKGTSRTSSLEQTTYAKGLEYMQNKNWDAAIKSFETVLSINPNHFQAAEQLKIAQNSLENTMQQRIIDKYYREGLNQLRNQKWVQAIVSFEKVLTLEPQHNLAKINLGKAQAGLNQIGTISIKESYYEHARQSIQNEDWILANSVLSKLIEIDKNYLDVQQLMAQVQEKILAMNKDFDLNKLYDDGENFIRNAKWVEAILVFQKVQSQNPNFKDVNLKLQFAKEQHERSQQLAQNQVQTESNGSTAKTIWIVLLAVLILSPGVLYFISPGFRGRIFLLLGKHNQGQKIYERLLDTGVMSDQLCLSLLHIYLIENRKDALAVKVYERALRLNLLKDRNKQELVSLMVVQYHLDGWENEIQKVETKMEKTLFSELDAISKKLEPARA